VLHGVRVRVSPSAPSYFFSLYKILKSNYKSASLPFELFI
jgi:hypothetical protein